MNICYCEYLAFSIVPRSEGRLAWSDTEITPLPPVDIISLTG